MINLYNVLGIPKNATSKDIKAAYRKLALQYHPDQAREMTQDQAEEKFKQINQAYDVLSTPAKRTQYDRWGTISSHSPSPRGNVVFSSFSRSYQSRREIIEEKLSKNESFDIRQFARSLGVDIGNLRKILTIFISKRNLEAKIQSNQFIFH